MSFPDDLCFQGQVILTSSYSYDEFFRWRNLPMSVSNEMFGLMPLPKFFQEKLSIDFENISGPSKSTTGVTLTNVLSCWFTNVCSNLAIKGASSYVSKGNGVSS